MFGEAGWKNLSRDFCDLDDALAATERLFTGALASSSLPVVVCKNCATELGSMVDARKRVPQLTAQDLLPAPRFHALNAAELRRRAVEAAAHVGELDHLRTARKRGQYRSCRSCYFWTGGSNAGCSAALLSGAKELDQHVPISSGEAERCVCTGWVDSNLGHFLQDGYAFDAIAPETRRGPGSDVPGGQARLAAIVRSVRGDQTPLPVTEIRGAPAAPPRKWWQFWT